MDGGGVIGDRGKENVSPFHLPYVIALCGGAMHVGAEIANKGSARLSRRYGRCSIAGRIHAAPGGRQGNGPGGLTAACDLHIFARGELDEIVILDFRGVGNWNGERSRSDA